MSSLPTFDDVPDLGPCCACSTTFNVRNIMCMPFKSPEPGYGWGCMECGLPPDGAVAFICDNCLDEEIEIQYIAVGPTAEHRRYPISMLTNTEPFDHDLSKHPRRTHTPSLLTALSALARADLAKLREGKGKLYDHEAVLCLYGADENGDPAQEQILCFSRPQDFATRPYMYYAFLHTYTYPTGSATFLIHFYADILLTLEDCRSIATSQPLGYNDWEWQPYAPSDPLKMDDFWDESLGEPVFHNDDEGDD